MAQSINLFRIGDIVRVSDYSLSRMASVSKKEEISTVTGKILAIRKKGSSELVITGQPHKDRDLVHVYYVEWNRPNKPARLNKQWRNENSLAKVSLA